MVDLLNSYSYAFYLSGLCQVWAGLFAFPAYLKIKRQSQFQLPPNQTEEDEQTFTKEHRPL